MSSLTRNDTSPGHAPIHSWNNVGPGLPEGKGAVTPGTADKSQGLAWCGAACLRVWVGTAGRYKSKRTRHVGIVQTDLTAPEEVGLAHTWREGSIPRTRSRSTEVDAYIFIKDTLKELGWDTRNPHRNSMGAVYTQNECL